MPSRLGGAGSAAAAINNSGQVTGYAGTYTYYHAFLYDGSEMQDLGSLTSSYSYASDINDSGQVVGYSQAPLTLDHAFLYTNGAMLDLGTLTGTNGPESRAYGINNSGQIVGAGQLSSYGAWHAFLYNNSAMTDLGVLPGWSQSWAYNINDLGEIVGSLRRSSPTTAHAAFVYRDNMMIDLNTQIDSSLGWTLTSAVNINNLGQIIGTGTYQGQSVAFLLTPSSLVVVPEPSGCAMLLVLAPAACASIVKHRRKRWAAWRDRTEIGGRK